MRWINRHKAGSLGARSWAVINHHVNYLISSSEDAGWHGQSNAGKICDMLETGQVPDFQGGGNSNAKMIREVELLTHSDTGLDYLFSDLTRTQKLCLFAAVLADGNKDERGVSPSNASIVMHLPEFAAKLRMKAPHKAVSVNGFEKHVSAGRSAFIRRLEVELKNRGVAVNG
ncbi:hypothetical protein [Marinomonas ostreistagni]|uniref:Uncharacterized protein n=1 Tax=Marinomonas ostreistagni TaxID=359209 RepID=A0ABS0ZAU9_9GAMM|nr:hypothetical protein [Marinomonas ostreistagni]MBJ7550762.1 hypothetical protein [Marinomonas ostreistagni]